MAGDPLRWERDAPLFIVPCTLDALRAFRAGPGLADLAGHDRVCLADALDRLGGRLLAGIEAHPTRFWVLKQFQASLDALRGHAEVRAHFRRELERLADILGMDRPDALLAHDLSGS